jgi:hypothetical protein
MISGSDAKLYLYSAVVYGNDAVNLGLPAALKNTATSYATIGVSGGNVYKYKYNGGDPTNPNSWDNFTVENGGNTTIRNP